VSLTKKPIKGQAFNYEFYENSTLRCMGNSSGDANGSDSVKRDWEIIADNLSKADGVGAVSQRLIPQGEQSGLQTHIATTESVSETRQAINYAHCRLSLGRDSDSRFDRQRRAHYSVQPDEQKTVNALVIAPVANH
jgi:hypothetical protein